MNITDDFEKRFYEADVLTIHRPKAFNELLAHARNLESTVARLTRERDEAIERVISFVCGKHDYTVLRCEKVTKERLREVARIEQADKEVRS